MGREGLDGVKLHFVYDTPSRWGITPKVSTPGFHPHIRIPETCYQLGTLHP